MTTSSGVQHNSKYMYKLITQESWDPVWQQRAHPGATFIGSPNDITDGFIHFSTSDLVQNTASKYYTNIHGTLLLIKINIHKMLEVLKIPVSDSGSYDDSGAVVFRYDKASNGRYYPHLYVPMPLACVQDVIMLEREEDGTPIIPVLED